MMVPMNPMSMSFQGQIPMMANPYFVPYPYPAMAPQMAMMSNSGGFQQPMYPQQMGSPPSQHSNQSSQQPSYYNQFQNQYQMQMGGMMTPPQGMQPFTPVQQNGPHTAQDPMQQNS